MPHVPGAENQPPWSDGLLISVPVPGKPGAIAFRVRVRLPSYPEVQMVSTRLMSRRLARNIAVPSLEKSALTLAGDVFAAAGT
jgi:hypothetical protein